MMKSYNSIKAQLNGLGRREQYTLLLETKEWAAFRDNIVSLDGHSCQKCLTKEGLIEEKIWADEEYEKILMEINDRNRAFEKRAKRRTTEEFMEQLLNGALDGLEPVPANSKVIGYVILQVHHKLYFWNKLPWEYARKNVTTLCSSCHKSEHRSKEIYMYKDESMKQKRVIPVCIKCGGSGYIPNYKHIDNGICWTCSGAGLIFDEEPVWLSVEK